MSAQAILPIAGVPDELIRVLNERFRALSMATAPAGTTKAPSSASQTTVIQSVLAGAAQVFYDTHVRRGFYAPSDGSVFVETDRNQLVYVAESGIWTYVAGVYRRTQAQLAALAATLTADDTGLLVEVTDYAHVLRWSGSAWGWGPGEPGSGMLQHFAVAPTGSGWHLCDGSLGVAYLKADGSTGTVNLPDTAATAAFLLGGPAYSATITAAALPTFSGTASQSTSAVSAGTPAGTVSQPTFTGNSNTTDAAAAHTHAIDHDHPSSTTSGPTGTQQVQSGTGITVANSAHSHSVDEPLFTGTSGSGGGHSHTVTPTGTVSQPTFTGSALGAHSHTLTPSGTIALPGAPVANVPAPLYFRQ